MLPAYTDVLIVGAGPAGLACANSLLKQGIKNFTIVDARAEGASNVSRAIVVHARTIEELNTIDCATPLVERGHHVQYVTFQSAQNKPLLQANFDSLRDRTNYPYGITISQSETEDVLYNNLVALSVEVLRPYRVSGFEGTHDGINVLFETGELVKTRYVVGADGLRSTVRRLVNIPFRDPSTNHDIQAEVSARSNSLLATSTGDHLFNADVFFSGVWTEAINGDAINVFLGSSGMFIVVQLPAAKGDPSERPMYRLIFTPEAEIKGTTLEQAQKALDEGLGLPKDRTPIIEELVWTSEFRQSSAVADKFYQPFGGGRVVLIGDSAHVHSPAGGQGMNLGIRDAIELGRVLSSIINFEISTGEVSPDTIEAFTEESLSHFSSERRKMAVKVIYLTKVLSWVYALKSTPARMIRNMVFKLMSCFTFAGDRMAYRLSGLE